MFTLLPQDVMPGTGLAMATDDAESTKRQAVPVPEEVDPNAGALPLITEPAPEAAKYGLVAKCRRNKQAAFFALL